jgi:hypothetical protein
LARLKHAAEDASAGYMDRWRLSMLVKSG